MLQNRLRTVRMVTMVALGLMAVGAAIWTISEALDSPYSESRSEIFEKDGVAITGNDPAYLQEQRAVNGSANYRTQYQGAIFQFASAANRDAFAADPQRFVPQYGGYYAFGVAGGHKGTSDAEAFTIVGGKLRPEMDVPPIVVKPGEGHSVSLGGMGVVFKVPGTATGGAFAVVEHPIEPGRLVPPHVHLHQDEYSYVLEGTIGARVGDKEVVAGPGSYVIKPRGLMHTFWNAGPGPARVLEVIAPAGFEKYFVELAEAGEPTQALAAKYGVTYSDDWVTELTSKYNLKLLGQ